MIDDAIMSPHVTRRRIVVGVDGSSSSVDALLWAELLGRAVDAEIDAITTWQVPASFGLGAPPDWNPTADSAELLAATLAKAFGDAVPSGLRTRVEQGHPAHTLIDASVGAQMLVVGSRGHGGFVGLLIGATSAYCAEHATCAVLVAHTRP